MAVEELVRRLDDRPPLEQVAGIIDEDVEAAECLDGFGEQALAKTGERDVAREENRLAAGLGNGARDLPGTRCIAVVVHADMGAGFSEPAGDGRPDAARGAGDEASLAPQIPGAQAARLLR